MNTQDFLIITGIADPSGNGTSGGGSITPVPDAPSNLEDIGSDPATPELNWINNGPLPGGDYTTIKIEQKKDAGAFVEVVSIDGSFSFYGGISLVTPGSYVFRVRGLVGGTYSPYSNITTPPNVVT